MPRHRSLHALIPALLLLAVPATAPAVDRYRVASGDTVIGEVEHPGTPDEFVIHLARGSTVTIAMNRMKPGNWRPAFGFFDDDYGDLTSSLQFVPTGPITATKAVVRNTVPIASSGPYRVVAQAGAVGATGRQSLGAYRFKATVRPATRFSLRARADDAEPATTLTFGAYAGYTATVQVRSKGPDPVTLAALTGPDGEPLEASLAPRQRRSTTTYGTFTIEEFGDHALELDVPESAVNWSAVVLLKGRLPAGTSLDDRRQGLPEKEGLRLIVDFEAPLVEVVGEEGGPNEFVFTASFRTLGEVLVGVPDAHSVDPRAENTNPQRANCARTPRNGDSPPTAYDLQCPNGLYARVEDVVRDGELAVVSYEVALVRTPRGAGSVTLSDFAYDDEGRPVGWTEVRRFDGTGNVHRLVISEVERFALGALKTYSVVHTPPGGEPRRYDYAPFSPR